MYMPTTGRFNRLDPFAGDLLDPLSFHKYGYVHNDPIQGIDPNGTFFTAVGSLVSSSIRTVMNNKHVGTSLLVLDRASTLADAAKVIGQLVFTGTVNPGLTAGLLVSVVPFGSILGKARLVGSKLIGFADEMTDAYRAMRQAGLSGKRLTQSIGDLGAIGVAKKMGFEPTNFPIRYHGIDGVMKKGDELILVEAKGGASGALGITAHGEQLSQQWIQRKITRLKEVGLGNYAKQLEDAIAGGKLQVMKVFTEVDDVGKVLDPVFELKNYASVGATTF